MYRGVETGGLPLPAQGRACRADSVLPSTERKLVYREVTTNRPELAAVPPLVVTVMRPLRAPLGTAVLMLVLLRTKRLARRPPKLSEVAPVKFLPLIITTSPTLPECGEKPVITGLGVAGTTTKRPGPVALPAPVVSLICPVRAPFGTIAWTRVLLWTEKLARRPPKVTEVTPERFLPVIVTVAPMRPLRGEKPVIVGVGNGEDVTVKLAVLRAVPAVVVTLTGPLIAPSGTNVVIWLVLSAVNDVAPAPVNATDVTLVNPEPVTVTRVPTGPNVGARLTILGATGGGVVTAKMPTLEAVPAAVAMEITPVTALGGTVAEIWVELRAVNSPGRLATPPNATERGFERLAPVMVTAVPGGPEVGEKPVTLGEDEPLVTV